MCDEADVDELAHCAHKAAKTDTHREVEMRFALPLLICLILTACSDPAADQARRSLRADILELQVAAEGKISHQELGQALQRIEAQRRALAGDGDISAAADKAVAALVESGQLVRRAMSEDFGCRHDGNYLPRVCLDKVLVTAASIGVPDVELDRLRKIEAEETERVQPLMLKLFTDEIEKDYAPGGAKHAPGADAEKQNALNAAKAGNDLFYSTVASLKFDDINAAALNIVRDRAGSAAVELR